ncbi:MAG: SDR family NAD(P)-dependent oxidoreductase [Parabacteroides sp.]|jgi:short-subunit dehydrogenase|nr:SDR family NAD(P)-dependent oxidoreductase [Parabacteroides sp.]MBP8759101.1 SDR family NAD(P)-dependent oxidoreductase [Parabacteroides sp.]MBP9480221.1 SDR family NAD(P)-dependent oxidoreductase [Parabacteroides sp.]MBP9578756.1 SDR family NAD(P)-dependent oxidoreductase [Parabacteroides sp.]MDD3359664.1 SDR family NAD(P)-dependent oxidoreductase [Parabacteroides sp.]
MKRVIIIGGTSGIGYHLAKGYLKKGWRVGVAGRREKELETLRAEAPEMIEIQPLDVTSEDASEKLQLLINKLGGMDLFVLSAGIGHQNRQLNPEIEINTAQTNVVGFIRMVTTAFHYFKEQGKGHLSVISSVAGTKGLGVAPAYSATKGFQNLYMDALAQQAHMEKLHITFTDIRPGFVETDLLKTGTYPMLMKPGKVAKLIMKALKNKKRVVVIDYRYAVIVFFWRLVPRWIWERVSVKNK